MVIETGFNIFFLYKYFLDYKDYRINKTLINEKKVIKNLQNNIHIKRKVVYLKGDISVIFYFLFELIISTVNLLTLFVSALIYIFTCGTFYSFDIKRLFIRKKINEINALNFFEKYSRSLEILRDNNVYKIYFIMLPFCKSLGAVKYIIYYLV